MISEQTLLTDLRHHHVSPIRVEAMEVLNGVLAQLNLTVVLLGTPVQRNRRTLINLVTDIYSLDLQSNSQ